MPPTGFCYWRCYASEPRTFRRVVNIYAGDQVSTIAQIAPDGAGGRTSLDDHRKTEGLMPGTCSLIEDMYYCGDDCEPCDYDF